VSRQGVAQIVRIGMGMRLLLVIHCLSCGGAERVLTSLANSWSERGDSVTIATMAASAPFYPLASAVRLHPLAVASESGSAISAIAGNFRRIRALRCCLRDVQPDLVISFMTPINVIAILAARSCGVPVVACEHTDPRHQELNSAWSALRIAVYPFARAVTFLTANVWRRWKPWLAGKAHLMPNPVTIETASASAALQYPRNLIAAGRLIQLKGFDLLIEAFGAIAPRHPDWGLTILGEGNMRRQLECQITEAGLTGRVQLPGRMSNPHAWFAAADLFVLSSRYEGLPCALCEAMACGTPAVSFDCESGPADVIRDGIDGLLVPPRDVKALSETLDRLMTDDSERERLGSRAAEIQERFGMRRVLERWDELFGSLGLKPS
jgi:GalNAc-alpha-(1->4)-GalNAc-alpha-(1->3)-diNAcBac-PP-undecaprenol alpha-1,4-N-acetyl-D-galactosaminyltransferase